MDAVADRAPLERALRKAQWRIIPLLAVCYLIAFMDRANIGFAAESMNRDLHFSPQVYGLGAGLFFVSYALCEIPSNRLLLRFGPRRWLARILLTWGVIAIAMLFVHSRPGFYGTRLLLGAAEAGYFPGALYYLSLWFPAARRARAISWFYMSLPLSSVVMGAAAGGLLHLDGRLGLHGWQWLFLIEGMPAVAMGVCLWFLLPDGPKSARWLSDNEREELRAVLLREGRAVEAEGGRGDLLRRALREPRVWGLAAFVLCIYGPSYAVYFFLPELVRRLSGFTAGTAGMLIAVSGVAGAAAMVLVAMSSDRTGDRRWHILVPSATIAGLLLFAGTHLYGMAAAVALLMTFVAYMSMQAPIMTLITEACAGEAAAVAIATINMFGIVGGFIGPYWMGWMRGVTGGYGAGIASLSVPWTLSLLIMLWVTRRNGNVTGAGEKTMNVEPELAK